MTDSKGGRGKKASYETTHVRIPLPIKAEVEKMSQAYRDGLLDQDDNSNKQLELGEALKIAKEILKAKKSARVSIEKLLTAIYKQDVEL